MHELAITKEMIKTVGQSAQEAGASRVTSIHLVIGASYGVVEDLLVKAFHYFSKDTICEDAALNIVFRPMAFICKDCHEVTYLDTAAMMPDHMICSNCNGSNLSLLSGNEFYIDKIEIEESSSAT